jgi:hypothetical protein
MGKYFILKKNTFKSLETVQNQVVGPVKKDNNAVCLNGCKDTILLIEKLH